MPLNPQNPHFSTPFRPLWCQSVKVKVSNCISAYDDMRHFIWLIIIYNILYIIIILYILLFIIISITFTYNFQLNNPPFKETVKSHPSLIKCQSEFDTLTLTLWHLILFTPTNTMISTFLKKNIQNLLSFQKIFVLLQSNKTLRWRKTKYNWK